MRWQEEFCFSHPIPQKSEPKIKNLTKGRPPVLEVPDTGNKNAEHPVKFEFQISDKSFFRISMSCAIFGTYLY